MHAFHTHEVRREVEAFSDIFSMHFAQKNTHEVRREVEALGEELYIISMGVIQLHACSLLSRSLVNSQCPW